MSFWIDEKKLHSMLDDALYHFPKEVLNRESILTPDDGAIIRDHGKEKALQILQARRSMGRFSFLENIAECIFEVGPHRRRIK